MTNDQWDVGLRMGGGSWEVGVSRQLLNDRVSISGNLDYIGSQDNSGKSPSELANPYLQNKILGDLDLDVKITDDGKFRFKAFNRANDQYAYNIYDQALHKQGVGLVYQEEFNTFGELISSYWKKLFGTKEEKKKP